MGAYAWEKLVEERMKELRSKVEALVRRWTEREVRERFLVDREEVLKLIDAETASGVIVRCPICDWKIVCPHCTEKRDADRAGGDESKMAAIEPNQPPRVYKEGLSPEKYK